MLRKILTLMMGFSLMTALAACDSSAQTGGTAVATPTQPAPAKAEAAPAGGKTLVVYFSRTGEQYGVGVIQKGNTAIVADMIAEKTGADKFELVPAEDKYPASYRALTDYAKEEMNSHARPAIAGKLPDLAGYDTIFIGAPVWWGDWPMICYTYFEANNFSGKRLVPFATHGGSGLAGFDSKLKKAAPGAEIARGLAVYGADTQNSPDSVRKDVNSWLQGLGY